MLPDTIKAAYFEELRFAKRQQWTITAAVVALIAGVYASGDVVKLAPWEKAVATILVIAVAAGGIYWLFDLQRHLYHTRLIIDRWDPDPWWRGGELVSGMAGAMVLSAIVVCYLLLRDGAYRSLLRMCLALINLAMLLINLAMLPMGFQGQLLLPAIPTPAIDPNPSSLITVAQAGPGRFNVAPSISTRSAPPG